MVADRSDPGRLGRPMGVPTGITITRVEAAVLIGTRPRVVGCNARLPTHGRFARDPVVRLYTDAGLSGWGWSRATLEEARTLVGRTLDDAFSLPEGTRDPYLSFDLPLWDLAGQALGQPVFRLLGGADAHPVPAYDGSIYIDDIDPDTGEDRGLAPILEAVTMGLEHGFRAFKVKVGRGYRWMAPESGLARDVEVLHAVRSSIGPDAMLMIDGNNGYSPETAREVMRLAGDADIHWFEEPFPESRDECVGFCQHLREAGWRTMVADGEGSEKGDEAFTAIVRAGGIDVVQFDMRFYGMTRWQRYLATIEETATLAAPHNWGSHLSTFYIAQFALACPRFAMAEVDRQTMPAVDAGGYGWVDGALTVPEAPGFGLGIDESTWQGLLRAEGAWAV